MRTVNFTEAPPAVKGKKEEEEEEKTQNKENNEEGDEREVWSRQCEFVLACIGYAVGYGNVWRFPYLCYKNGGAVFLIPYIIVLFSAGLPLFFMELALGQYLSLGPNILFVKLAPVAAGIGWAMLVISGLVCVYYNMLLAWTLFYTYASFTSVLPWSNCENSFNTIGCTTDVEARNCSEQNLVYFNKMCYDIDHLCNLFNATSFNSTHCSRDVGGNMSDILQVGKITGRLSASEDFYKNRMLQVTGTSWENMGGMQWEMVGCLALAWLIVYLCLIKGIQSAGKVVYFTALFPYVILIILFIRGVTLHGSELGIRFYFLEVKWESLLKVEVWNDAATQIFYSLGSSFGGLITLASYSRFKNNCMRDAIFIALSNTATAIFTGFAIFSILGFMATELKVSIDEVVTSGSGLAFVAYPEALTKMPIPVLWSILFFFMLTVIGLDSQFGMVETLTTAIFDQFEWLRSKKPLIVLLVCFALFLCGLTQCLHGGVYMLDLLDGYSASLSLVIVGLFEIIAVQYIYGFEKFMDNIRIEMDIKMSSFMYYYWKATWLFLTPLTLVMIFGFGVYFWTPLGTGSYIFPQYIQGLGWAICCSSFIIIPIIAIYVIFQNRIKKENWRLLFKSSEDFCPAHERKLRTQIAEALNGVPTGAVFMGTSDSEGCRKRNENNSLSLNVIRGIDNLGFQHEVEKNSFSDRNGTYPKLNNL